MNDDKKVATSDDIDLNAHRLNKAQEVLQIEADSILALREQLGAHGTALQGAFAQLVEMILGLSGKVVVSGVGKSAIIGQKIVATMCSTGTPAVYLDSTAALHGDLGVVAHGDLLIAISNSGEATELLNVLFAARQIGAGVVAMTGNPNSTLAENSDLVLPVGVAREACPLGLAPTASTTAVLAVGDALAMVLMEARQFTSNHYARFHPGGNLGQRLKLKVRDIMQTAPNLPVVGEDATLQEALQTMSIGANLGVVLITNRAGKLSGIITDGDVRRYVAQGESMNPERPVAEIMKHSPMTVDADAGAGEALRIMEKGTGKGSITSLAIVDLECRPVGIIHLHDILGRGKFMV